MKRTLLTLILLTLSVVASEAQTYPRSTTLAANLTANATVVSVASGTGIATNGALWIDAEFLPVTSCANAACTLVNVVRTQKAMAHASSTVVTVISSASRPNTMLAHSAAWREGQCSTSTSSLPSTALAGFQFLPIFDIDTGDVYMCRRNGDGGAWVWNKTNSQNFNGTAGSVWTAWP